MDRLAESIQAITIAGSIEAAKTEIIHAFGRMGFDRLCLSINKRDRIELLEAPDINNFGGGSQTDYNEAKMREFDDDAVKAILHGHPSFYDTRTTTAWETRHFFGFLASYGVIGGIVVPLKSSRNLCSGMLLGSGEAFSTEPHTLLGAAMLANVSMMKLELIDACERLPADEAQALRALTAQQHDLLHWAAEGKSNTDIATITGLSRRGVDYHMGQIFKKLGINSKAQAVALMGKSPLIRRQGD